MPNEIRRSTFRIEVEHAESARVHSDDLRVCFEADPISDVVRTQADVDVWRPSLAPDSDLLREYSTGCCGWYEFSRRYSIQLQSRSEDCERLRSLAWEVRLVLLHRGNDPHHNLAVAMKQHLERLECQHRWNAGLMIGGYLYPLRSEVIRHGGLWFDRHSAWMMPDREAWNHIQALLPGDF